MSIGNEPDCQLPQECTQPEPGDTGPQIDATEWVLRDIARERQRQDVKFGVQDYPLLDPQLTDRGPVQMAAAYHIPTAASAHVACGLAARRGDLTWAHLLVEHLARVVGTTPGDATAMREQLVQLAATATAAVEYIDRHHPF